MKRFATTLALAVAVTAQTARSLALGFRMLRGNGPDWTWIFAGRSPPRS